MYHGLRNVSFLVNSEYVLHEGSLTSLESVGFDTLFGFFIDRNLRNVKNSTTLAVAVTDFRNKVDSKS